MIEKRVEARSPALDVVRIFALFCVVSIHFFLHSGYYSITIVGPRMYVATLMRTFLGICVPLFMMLTGYLMKTRKPSRDYYRKLTGLLAEYLLASICCVVYQAFVDGTTFDISMVINTICGLFAFDAAHYGWYVEMYIGLFLLIPYLNLLYGTLSDKKSKQGLILTLLILTAVPSIANYLRMDWLFPNNEVISYTHFTPVPRWWTGIYPITYYYIGAYLSEYPLNLSKSMCMLLSGVVLLISSSLAFLQSYRSKNILNFLDGYESLFTVLQTTLVFSFITKISYKQLSARMSKCLSYISKLCFSAYLVSFIFDDYFYNAFGWFERGLVYRLELYFVMVPLVFVCSLALSAVINTIIRALSCCFAKLRTSGHRIQNGSR